MAIHYLKPRRRRRRRRRRWAKLMSLVTTTNVFLCLFVVYVLYMATFGD
jgi:hypothetical protein